MTLKEVKLLIDSEEEDDVLLGELDFFVRQRFKVKKIEVGEENLIYKK